MKIRVASDIHWEFDWKKFHQTRLDSGPDDKWVDHFWTPPELPDDNDTILVLAGDLWYGGKSVEVIETFARRFKKVLVVFGNHDFWTSDYEKFSSEEMMMHFHDNLERFNLQDHVVLIDSNSITFDGITFVGATLWTDMDDGNPIVMSDAKWCMAADFSKIWVDTLQKRRFSVADWIKLNAIEFNYIENVVKNEKGRGNQVVVITHHLPSLMSCHPRYFGKLENYYFASEYKNTISEWDNVPLWIHGHTHDPMDYHIGNTRIVCNPRGYPGENSDGFNSELVVELGKKSL